MFNPPPADIPHTEQSQVAQAPTVQDSAPIIQEVPYVSFDEAVRLELREKFDDFEKKPDYSQAVEENKTLGEIYWPKSGNISGTFARKVPGIFHVVRNGMTASTALRAVNTLLFTELEVRVLSTILSTFDENELMQELYTYTIVKNLYTENPVKINYFIINQKTFRFEYPINPDALISWRVIENICACNICTDRAL